MSARSHDLPVPFWRRRRRAAISLDTLGDVSEAAAEHDAAALPATDATAPAHRRQPRAWAPVLAAIIAGALIFAVLPQPLSVPQQDPTAAAAYAPVPGPATGEAAAAANFARTTSAGVGAGGPTSGGIDPGPLPPPAFVPRQKNCVGDPPRQTEDPLSPPCVPLFVGDNGGVTAPGVTKDEVTIVFYNDLYIAGDLTKPWRPSDERGPARERAGGSNNFVVRTIKAHLRTFQERYQTYGRRVRLIAVPSKDSWETTCGQRRIDARAIVQEVKPFAAVLLSRLPKTAPCFWETFVGTGRPGMGIMFVTPPELYRDLHPLMFGFFPDRATQQAWTGSFICRKLEGRPARFSKDDELRTETRRFAMIRPTARDETIHDLGMRTKAEVARGCGLRFAHEDEYDPGEGAGVRGRRQQTPWRDAVSVMQKYKLDGVSTIVCACDPFVVGAAQNAADALDYHPEWIYDNSNFLDRAMNHHCCFTSGNQVGFGVSHHWRAPRLEEQHHYQAYLQAEPGSRPNTRWSFNSYHLFLNLFQGIQAAGPTLTPENIARGMFTFNYLDRSNVYSPIGGYGNYGPNAVSPHTFIDTAMAFWWDPTGTPPGGQEGTGCIRVAHGGRRFYADEWYEGDWDLMNPTDPCSADQQVPEDVRVE